MLTMETRGEPTGAWRRATSVALACVAVVAAAAPARSEQLEVVGSSTVYPFTAKVAERFSQARGHQTPKVESTGTGGGMKLLCAGVGEGHADMTNASRPIKPSEIELCASNGVSEPVEVKIGYDGIVVAHGKGLQPFSVTREQLFLALARDLPDDAGNLAPNPNVSWGDVGAGLPAVPIRVYGPPPTSGTRDAFTELALEVGCEAAPGMEALKARDEDAHESACKSVREDGAFIEAGENDNLIIQRLVSNEDTLGIFGYSFLEENADKVVGVMVDGVTPTYESIGDGSYPLSRPLFVYVKAEHAAVKPSLAEFVEFFLSEDSLGQEGFLADLGLVPLPPDELGRVRSAVGSRL